jgi:LPXTG-motif cell wall-anchored protein
MAPPRLMRRFLTGVIAGSALLLTASPADGDVGVGSVRPTVGAPGQSVELDAGCGGPRCGPQLPISLVPLARAPTPQPCHAGKTVCSPEAAEPPRQPPYVFLGWAKQDSASSADVFYRLRFRVPEVAPGVYAFVIFCGGCAAGRRGTLVVTTSQPGKLLRVRSEQNPVASQGSGTDTPWLIAAAAGVAAIAGAAVFLRRRRAR